MTNDQLNCLFLRVAEELDISDTLFDKAVTSYMALGEYINNHCECLVNVYTQGSFRLGTVIRPLGEEDEYDLDIVSEVSGTQTLSPEDLKQLIGDILSGSKRYSSMLEEKKRCWRIEYSDEAQFHMDITPAIPDTTVSSAILITNKSNNGICSFMVSNPKGYSEWFDIRKATSEIIQKMALFETSVEPAKTKDNKHKLPLQRAIQILKRHRDKMFEDYPDDKPISIIITTLSAMVYNGELGVYDSLVKVLESMHQAITVENGKYYISNPESVKNFV
ncbi:MAG: nucleotidyltransferase [Christensenellaceae bacterium]|nr:nucleotidyltransferase [Christensenellaceae bacterium]